MINFVRRPLSGFYKGSLANQFSDYIKIDNSFLELALDLPLLDQRITTLESNALGILTTSNFVTNSISGTVILENTISGSKLQDSSIPGSKIVVNSLSGITDANIAANAAINPSKIDLGLLSHTQIKDIGSRTHAQIDNQLDQVFSDIGSTPGSPLAQALDTRVTANAAGIAGLSSSFSALNNYVAPATLTTNAQVVSSAINELKAALQSVGASGYSIQGPGVTTVNAMALWNASNGSSLKDSSVVVSGVANDVVFPGGIRFNIPTNIANPALPVNTTFTQNITSPSTLTLTAGSNTPVNIVTAGSLGALNVSTVGGLYTLDSNYLTSPTTIVAPNFGTAASPANHAYTKDLTVVDSGHVRIVETSHILTEATTNSHTGLHINANGGFGAQIIGDNLTIRASGVNGFGRSALFLQNDYGATLSAWQDATVESLAGNVYLTPASGVYTPNIHITNPIGLYLPQSGVPFGRPGDTYEFAGYMKYNFTATGAPTANDDGSGGYGVGSMWFNTVANDVYICCDPSVTTAVWKKITP